MRGAKWYPRQEGRRRARLWSQGWLRTRATAAPPLDSDYSLHAEPVTAHSPSYTLQTWREVKVSQSCPTLCNPMDCSPPGSSVQGMLWTRILEWVPLPSLGDLPDPGIEPRLPALQVDSLPAEPPGTPSSKQPIPKPSPFQAADTGDVSCHLCCFSP